MIRKMHRKCIIFQILLSSHYLELFREQLARFLKLFGFNYIN